MLKHLASALLATTILTPVAFAEQPPSPPPAKAELTAKVEQPQPPPKPVVDIHEPVAGPADPRLRTWDYQPGVIMKATSTGLTPIRFVFPAGEAPYSTLGGRVAIDPKSAKDWYAVQGQNEVTVQPLRTNIPVSFMFIDTVQAGMQRHYTIELKQRDGNVEDPEDKLAMVQVTFLHADPAAAADAAAEAKAKANLVKGQQIKTSLTQARFSAPRNWHYKMRGSGCATFAPHDHTTNWIGDDGQQVSVLFAGRQRPAVVTTTDDEGDPEMITPTVISHRAGTLFVLPSTYEKFELRRGRLVCEIKPETFDPQGKMLGNGSGTISPDVLLRMRQQRRSGQ